MRRFLCTIGTLFAAIAGALAVVALIGAIFFAIAAYVCYLLGFAMAAVVLAIIALCLVIAFVVVGLAALVVAALVNAGSCPGFDPFTGRIPAASGATAGFVGGRGLKWPFHWPAPPPWFPPLPVPCGGPAPFGFDWARFLQCLGAASGPCGGKESPFPGRPGADPEDLVGVIRWIEDRVNDEREARRRAKEELKSYREHIPEGPARDAVDAAIAEEEKEEKGAADLIGFVTATAGAVASRLPRR